MPRKASVRYWASRGGYCCWHKGKQILLATGPDDFPDGTTYLAALRKFGSLATGVSTTPTLREVCDHYLEWLLSHRSADTLKIRRQRLADLCAEFGAARVATLTAFQIESWCDRQAREKHWSPTTTKILLDSLSACLRWAAAKGLLAVNPISKLETPRPLSRGMECVLSPEQEAAALAACRRRSVLELVTVLRETGCRPGELQKAEAHHFNPERCALVLPAFSREGKGHKTAATGKARVIFLEGKALEVVRALVAKYPKGPLFRSPSPLRTGPHAGERWGWTSSAIRNAFLRLRQRSNNPGLIPYSFRHTFAVRWLTAGMSADDLAAVLGTSRRMIERHYGHLAEQLDYLRSAYLRFKRPEGE